MRVWVLVRLSVTVCMCVCGCVRICEYYENSLYFAQLPWFYLLFVVVASVGWQKYFFLHCFLSDLISEWIQPHSPNQSLLSLSLTLFVCCCLAEILL